MAASAKSRGVQLDFLRDDARVELIEILESLRGRKCLVLDVPIGGLLNHIIPEGSKLLKDNGVQYFRELRGELGNFSAADGGSMIPDHIVYLTRPSIANMKLISKQIQSCVKAGLRSQFQYHVYFIPHRAVACEQMLEDEGVLDIVNTGEFHLGLIPFDSDIVSLEMEDLYKQCYVDGDLSSLDIVARSLHKLQSIYGVIPNIKSKGAASKKVLQKLLHLCCESSDESRTGTGQSAAWSGLGSGIGGEAGEGIDSMILFDREVDLFSPLLTPLTYEGVIDEVFGIENGRIKVDASLLGEDKSAQLNIPASMRGTSAEQQIAAATAAATLDEPELKKLPGEKVALPLNNSDGVFKECRDLSIEALGSYLQEKAISTRKRYSDFRDNKDTSSFSDLHSFIKKIPELRKEYKSLHQHINIAERLKQTTDSYAFRQHWQAERGVLEGEPMLDQVEELIVEDTERVHIFKCLRLFCLISLTGNGVQAKKFDYLRKLIVHTYGFEHLFTIMNLEKAGLLKRKDNVLLDTSSTSSSPMWISLRHNLRLINEGVNMVSPDDLAYVTAGFAPLLARLVQGLSGVSLGGSFAEALKLLPGPLLEFTQVPGAPFEELNDVLERSKKQSNPAESTAEESNDPFMTQSSLVPFFSEDEEAPGKRKKVLLVFFVGGLSYVEIAALRHLSNDPAFPFSIIIGTTSVGSSLLKSLVHTSL